MNKHFSEEQCQTPKKRNANQNYLITCQNWQRRRKMTTVNAAELESMKEGERGGG